MATKLSSQERDVHFIDLAMPKPLRQRPPACQDQRIDKSDATPLNWARPKQ